MNELEFINALEKINIILTDDQLNKLKIYMNYLIEYNNFTNLTNITEPKLIYLKHFYDSLTIFLTNEIIDIKNKKSLIDIGCGAGFPGMVLAICFTNLEVTLLDSNNKKITFLNNLIEKLNIKNVKTINERSEIYALNNLDKYDLVISRAVSALPVLSELCIPLVKVGGYFVAMKANINDELIKSQKIIKLLNSEVKKEIEFVLPIENSKRTIVVIKKEDKTPEGYPRNYNKIIKENK